MSWLSRTRFGRWAHFALLPLAGFDARPGVRVAVLAAARGVVIAGAVLAFGYLLNAVADRASDHPGKNPFTGVGVPRGVTAVLGGLAAMALVASAWAPASARLATAVCLASGVLYSVGPRLKRYPVLGTLSNVTNFAPLLWVGTCGAQGAAPALRPLAASFVCLLLQNQLLHEAADRQEDARGGVRTTVLLLGERRAALAAALLGAALLAAARPAHAFGLVVGPLAAAYVVLFPLALAARGADAAAMNGARVAHRACSVVTGGLLFALLR